MTVSPRVLTGIPGSTRLFFQFHKNIRQYGAREDASPQQNTLVIQRALSDRGSVYVPDGLFPVSASLSAAAGATLTGYGTIRMMDSASAFATGTPATRGMVTAAGDKVIIEGVTLDGNEANQVHAYGADLGTHVALVSFGDYGGCQVRHATLRNCAWGILGGSCVNPRIVGNEITGITYQAVNISAAAPANGTRGWVDDNHFATCRMHAVSLVNTDGMMVRHNTVYGDWISAMRGDVSAAVDGVYTITHYAPAGYHDFTDVAVGHYLVVGIGTGLPVEVHVRTKVSNSVLKVVLASGSLAGAPYANAPLNAGTGDLINYQDCNYGLVEGNDLSGGMSAAILPWSLSAPSVGHRIIGNTCRAQGGSPIGLQSYRATYGLRDVVVEGNSVYDGCLNDPALGTDLAGSISFYGSGEMSEVLVNGNGFYDDQGTPPASQGKALYWAIINGASITKIGFGRNLTDGQTNNGISGALTTPVLSAEWGTAAVSLVVCNGPSYEFTITVTAGVPATGGSITIPLKATGPENPPHPMATISRDGGANYDLPPLQNYASGITKTQHLFVWPGLPVVGAVYKVTVRA